MAYIVYLTSGKEINLNDIEYRRMMARMVRVGRNFPIFECDNGDTIFMDRIEYIEDLAKSGRITVGRLEEERKAAMPKVETEGDTPTNEDLLAEIMNKSNCTHPAEAQALYMSDSKNGIRYFTLCDECGGNRSKFVAAAKLTDEEKDTAKLYIEKE